MLLQEALGLPTPHYLHTALVLGANGEKLSKQNGAKALNLGTDKAICQSLISAAMTLGICAEPDALNNLEHLPSALAYWGNEWANEWSNEWGRSQPTKIEA
jgi:glutamyl-Q tRNA(Asp) synthetase